MSRSFALTHKTHSYRTSRSRGRSQNPAFFILYRRVERPRTRLEAVGIKWQAGQTFAGPNKVNSDTLPRYLHEFLLHANTGGRPAAGGAWLLSTERLIRYLDVLLNERETLLKALDNALNDLDVASVRIEQLEVLNDLLLKERYRTKGRTDRNFIANVAIAITTLLGPMGGVALDHRLAKPIGEALNTAQQVVQDFGDTSISIEIADPEDVTSDSPHPTVGRSKSGRSTKALEQESTNPSCTASSGAMRGCR